MLKIKMHFVWQRAPVAPRCLWHIAALGVALAAGRRVSSSAAELAGYCYAILSQDNMWRRISLCLFFGVVGVVFLLSSHFAQAQEAAEEAIVTGPGPEHEELPPDLAPTIASSVPALRHIKKELLDLGLNFQVNYTGEVFGNPTGGVKQRGIYEDLIETALDGDLDKIAGLKGASFHINSYEINGFGLSLCCVFNVLTVSSIEALATTRLYEAWFEQKLFDGVASVRIGQLGADTEFFISDFGALYINATFGWPNILAADLPSTGPNYPLAAPGARLKVTPNDQITLLGAIFNGDTSGAGFTGLQEIFDRSGTNFRLRDPPLLIGEAQYKYNQDKNSAGLAGTVRLGAWYQIGNLFLDQRYSTNGLSLANPLSTHVPLIHFGDYGVYGIIDQMIWRLPGGDQKKGVGVFARVSASPSDRNVAAFYADGGINFIGLWDQRPDDMFGAAVAYSPVSSSVRALDSDVNFFANTHLPVQDYEMAVELTYKAQIIPGWYVQPEFQYIFHPGYGVINPINPAVGRIPDAAVFGLATITKF
jgi:porin